METKNADLSSLRIDRKEKNVNPENKQKYANMLMGIVGLALLIFLIFYGYNKLFSASIEVELTAVTLQSPSQTNAVLNASGYVVAQRKAAVASKGMGRLIYLGVVEGDRVFNNQIIARLDDSDIKAQYEQAKANLKFSEADLNDAENSYRRAKSLLESGATSQMEVDAAESRYKRVLASIDVARAQILSAEVAIENMLVRAPFDGTVLTKNADVGEIVAPMAGGLNSKAAVVTIADMNSLQVEADVNESNIEKIVIDQNCEIRLDAYPDQSYPGYVAKIVPTADRSKATVMVKIGFKSYDKRVLPEMSAKVLFMKNQTENLEIEDAKQFMVVPETSVRKKNETSVVFVINDDTAVELPVTTGKQIGSYVEIISGLEVGDRVIENLTDKIQNGIKVSIK